jgi:hypothetical protein
MNFIQLYKRIFLIINIIICSVLTSCNGQTKNDFSLESFEFEKMDTNSINDNLISQQKKYNSLSLEDIKIGERILLNSIPKEITKRKQITNIITEGFKQEKYDSLSNRIYEKYTSWSRASTYKYHFDYKGRPDFILYNTDTIKYKYDNLNRLINCGNLTIKYFPNGFKKSVEDPIEIETYEYDQNGNICHINFIVKPNNVTCGNRTSEWFGEYDEAHKLIREIKISFPFTIIQKFIYSEKGDLIQSISYEEFSKDKIIRDYFYKNHTLTVKKRGNK